MFMNFKIYRKKQVKKKKVAELEDYVQELSQKLAELKKGGDKSGGDENQVENIYNNEKNTKNYNSSDNNKFRKKLSINIAGALEQQQLMENPSPRPQENLGIFSKIGGLTSKIANVFSLTPKESQGRPNTDRSYNGSLVRGTLTEKSQVFQNKHDHINHLDSLGRSSQRRNASIGISPSHKNQLSQNQDDHNSINRQISEGGLMQSDKGICLKEKTNDLYKTKDADKDSGGGTGKQKFGINTTDNMELINSNNRDYINRRKLSMKNKAVSIFEVTLTEVKKYKDDKAANLSMDENDFKKARDILQTEGNEITVSSKNVASCAKNGLPFNEIDFHMNMDDHYNIYKNNCNSNLRVNSHNFANGVSQLQKSEKQKDVENAYGFDQPIKKNQQNLGNGVGSIRGSNRNINNNVMGKDSSGKKFKDSYEQSIDKRYGNLIQQQTVVESVTKEQEKELSPKKPEKKWLNIF